MDKTRVSIGNSVKEKQIIQGYRFVTVNVKNNKENAYRFINREREKQIIMCRNDI